MRWNQLANDIPRATALADILCAAIGADGRIDENELVVVDAMIMKVLGQTTLPDSMREHVRAQARKRSPDLTEAFARLALGTEREKQALVKTVTDIALADGKITKSESKFLTRLHELLGLTPPATA